MMQNLETHSGTVRDTPKWHISWWWWPPGPLWWMSGISHQCKWKRSKKEIFRICILTRFLTGWKLNWFCREGQTWNCTEGWISRTTMGWQSKKKQGILKTKILKANCYKLIFSGEEWMESCCTAAVCEANQGRKRNLSPGMFSRFYCLNGMTIKNS